MRQLPAASCPDICKAMNREPFDIDRSNAHLAGAFLGVILAVLIMGAVVYIFGPPVFARLFDNDQPAHAPSEYERRR